MEMGRIRQHRLSDNIVEQLETMILEGTLQPGQRLPAERGVGGAVWRLAAVGARGGSKDGGEGAADQPPGRR